MNDYGQAPTANARTTARKEQAGTFVNVDLVLPNGSKIQASVFLAGSTIDAELDPEKVEVTRVNLRGYDPSAPKDRASSTLAGLI